MLLSDWISIAETINVHHFLPQTRFGNATVYSSFWLSRWTWCEQFEINTEWKKNEMKREEKMSQTFALWVLQTEPPLPPAAWKTTSSSLQQPTTTQGQSEGIKQLLSVYKKQRGELWGMTHQRRNKGERSRKRQEEKENMAQNNTLWDTFLRDSNRLLK